MIPSDTKLNKIKSGQIIRIGCTTCYFDNVGQYLNINFRKSFDKHIEFLNKHHDNPRELVGTISSFREARVQFHHLLVKHPFDGEMKLNPFAFRDALRTILTEITEKKLHDRIYICIPEDEEEWEKLSKIVEMVEKEFGKQFWTIDISEY